MNYLKFLRNKNPFNNVVMSDTLRGAKRKGEKKEILKSEHILNLYKNADDVKVLPDEYYPIWLFNLAQQPYNYDEMMNFFICGHGVSVIIIIIYSRFHTLQIY